MDGGMTFYQRLFFPWLQRLDAETAHEWTLAALALAQNNEVGRALLHAIRGRMAAAPVSLWGLTFPNVLGVAAGFDKDARAAAGLAALGFGHVEVGTLTPRPQVGNPRPRVFRLAADGAIINRMGFPNEGAAAAVPRLQALSRGQRDFVLGVSLGKQKETALAEALTDYTAVMQAVFPYADYLAVNISSPNTPGLRELQGGNYLVELLAGIFHENHTLAAQHHLPPRPLLVKIAPDLTWAELDEILSAAQTAGISGLIATNTTIDRPPLRSPQQQESGGLSGAPLRARSLAVVAYIQRQMGGLLPVIGVGGVCTAADVQALLAAGASLVQVYTGLVYEGPGWAGRVLRQMGGEMPA